MKREKRAVLFVFCLVAVVLLLGSVSAFSLVDWLKSKFGGKDVAMAPGLAGNYYISVTEISDTIWNYETSFSSKVWESWVLSDLATKILHYKTNSNQYSADIEYHDGWVYADTYLKGKQDSLYFEELGYSRSKLSFNKTLSSMFNLINKGLLPYTLSDLFYQDKKGNFFRYSQEISLGPALIFTRFSDSDYKSRELTSGFRLLPNSAVLNYTLDFFVTNPSSKVVNGDLIDFENTRLKMLDTDFYIVDFKNSSLKMTLLESGMPASLSQGNITVLMINGKNHSVSVDFIDINKVILNIDGVPTEMLHEEESAKLPNNLYLRIDSILISDGKRIVNFAMGLRKWEIQDIRYNDLVTVNDHPIEGLTARFSMGSFSGGTIIPPNSNVIWQKLKLEWRNEDEEFLTPEKELIFPGFESIKFNMSGVNIPYREVSYIKYGGQDYAFLHTKIKDGDVSIPFIYIDTSTCNIKGIGQSATQLLATTDTNRLVFNASSGVNLGFIASWADSKQGESYYLTATVRNDTDGVRAITTIRNKITGVTMCEDLPRYGTCTIGNVVLTVNEINWSSERDSRVVTFTINSGGSFYKLYTKKGLTFFLPLNKDIYGKKFILKMSEEDRNSNLGQKNFSVAISCSGVPNDGILKITSTQPQTNISINGVNQGYAPITRSLESNKINTYIASKPGYISQTRTVVLNPGEIYSWNFNLISAPLNATLNITSSLPDTNITINNIKQNGYAPIYKSVTPDTYYTVMANAPGKKSGKAWQIKALAGKVYSYRFTW